MQVCPNLMIIEYNREFNLRCSLCSRSANGFQKLVPYYGAESKVLSGQSLSIKGSHSSGRQTKLRSD